MNWILGYPVGDWRVGKLILLWKTSHICFRCVVSKIRPLNCQLATVLSDPKGPGDRKQFIWKPTWGRKLGFLMTTTWGAAIHTVWTLGIRILDLPPAHCAPFLQTTHYVLLYGPAGLSLLSLDSLNLTWEFLPLAHKRNSDFSQENKLRWRISIFHFIMWMLNCF